VSEDQVRSANSGSSREQRTTTTSGESRGVVDRSAGRPYTPSAGSLSVVGPAAAREPIRRVLLVDDEAAIRLALGKLLRSPGFDVETADSGRAALDALERGRFSLMLCDIRMPGMTGLEVVPQALAIDPELAVMMLTAVNDAASATEALSNGAFDYLLKPPELSELLQAAERALKRRDLAIEQRRVEALIREEVAIRTEELEREKLALRELTVDIAETLINAMEAKDVYLRGHSQRVADLAAAMAERLGLDPDTVEHVRLAGRLHDVGKIGIRESVLNKPEKLSPEEFSHVKDHVRVGMEILAPLKHIGVVLEFVQDHHEHWDGGGYPRRLAGDRISIGGRILAAADAFDALTSKRAYREPMSPEEVVDYLGENEVGRLLDPTVFAVLRKLVLAEKSHVLTFIDDLHG
jgi:putative nucleotidyltransferase with HDIG domain